MFPYLINYYNSYNYCCCGATKRLLQCWSTKQRTAQSSPRPHPKKKKKEKKFNSIQCANFGAAKIRSFGFCISDPIDKSQRIFSANEYGYWYRWPIPTLKTRSFCARELRAWKWCEKSSKKVNTEIRVVFVFCVRVDPEGSYGVSDGSVRDHGADRPRSFWSRHSCSSQGREEEVRVHVYNVFFFILCCIVYVCACMSE